MAPGTEVISTLRDLIETCQDAASAVTGLDDATILAERLRAEEAALAGYEHALEMGLPSDIRIVVERQRWAIQEARHHLDALGGGRAHEGGPGVEPKRGRQRVARGRAPGLRKPPRGSGKSARKKRRLSKPA